jgi:hypothetical protein
MAKALVNKNKAGSIVGCTCATSVATCALHGNDVYSLHENSVKYVVKSVDSTGQVTVNVILK